MRNLIPRLLSLALVPLAACTAPPGPPASEATPEVAPVPADPYRWLEDVTAERSLEWARAHNAKSQGELADEAFKQLETRLKAQYDSDAKIPGVQKIGAHYYNLW
ncbi:MAG: hypothetical protein ABL998_15940, partial [Planctomycetota bacterium]